MLCLSARAFHQGGPYPKEMDTALDLAERGHIVLIPVRLDDAVLPARLRHLHAVNLYEHNSYKQIVDGIRGRAQSLLIRSPVRRTATGQGRRSHVEVTFAPDVGADDIKFALDALADYYRACGGVGFRIDDCEREEAVIREPTHA